MFPFRFTKAADEAAALSAAAAGARYIAGGTTLVDLMRETVERPEAVVDINALPYRDIDRAAVAAAGRRAGADVGARRASRCAPAVSGDQRRRWS